MKKFYQKESDYSLVSCEKDMVTLVMDFFGREWDRGHRLAVNRSYVDNYFYDFINGNYNILIALDRADRVIGILAFVGNDFYDRAITGGDRFIWITNWLVEKGARNGIGLTLLSALEHSLGVKSMGTLGNNQTAEVIYRALGYNTGRLGQYFIVNENKRSFQLLQNYKMTNTHDIESDPEVRLWPVDDLGDLADSEALRDAFEYYLPRKSLTYLKNKYVESKAYKYLIYGVECGRSAGAVARGAQALLILKVVEHNNARAIRIVEYAGFDCYLRGLSREFQRLLDDFDAEYLDFYSLTEPPGGCGFVLNTGDGGLVVPDYYEPFNLINVDMRYAYLFLNDRTRIFKGDCDREFGR